MAPLAMGAAVSALGLDASLAATGHGNWKHVAVDGALMALPVAGKLASRAVAGRQAGRFVAPYPDEILALNLSNRIRPATVAGLKTRNLGTSTFRGATRAPSVQLHPRLQEALDRVPLEARSRFHEKCAEIRAIDDALKHGGVLRDAVIQTRKVRPLGGPDHGFPHQPCSSCSRVLRDLGIKYKE